MLPAKSYFKTLECPFFVLSHDCTRPYCHFKHPKKDSILSDIRESAEKQLSSYQSKPFEETSKKLLSPEKNLLNNKKLFSDNCKSSPDKAETLFNDVPLTDKTDPVEVIKEQEPSPSKHKNTTPFTVAKPHIPIISVPLKPPSISLNRKTALSNDSKANLQQYSLISKTQESKTAPFLPSFDYDPIPVEDGGTKTYSRYSYEKGHDSGDEIMENYKTIIDKKLINSDFLDSETDNTSHSEELLPLKSTSKVILQNLKPLKISDEKSTNNKLSSYESSCKKRKLKEKYNVSSNSSGEMGQEIISDSCLIKIEENKNNMTHKTFSSTSDFSKRLGEELTLDTSSIKIEGHKNHKHNKRSYYDSSDSSMGFDQVMNLDAKKLKTEVKNHKKSNIFSYSSKRDDQGLISEKQKITLEEPKNDKGHKKSCNIFSNSSSEFDLKVISDTKKVTTEESRNHKSHKKSSKNKDNNSSQSGKSHSSRSSSKSKHSHKKTEKNNYKSDSSVKKSDDNKHLSKSSSSSSSSSKCNLILEKKSSHSCKKSKHSGSLHKEREDKKSSKSIHKNDNGKKSSSHHKSQTSSKGKSNHKSNSDRKKDFSIRKNKLQETILISDSSSEENNFPDINFEFSEQSGEIFSYSDTLSSRIKSEVTHAFSGVLKPNIDAKELPPVKPAGRIRIAHVPNVSSFLSAKEQIKQVTSRTDSLKKTSTNNLFIKTTEVCSPFSKKEAQQKPVITGNLECSVPVPTRQSGLRSIFDEFSKFLDFNLASEKAVSEELDISFKAKCSKTYKNLIVLSILKIRKNQGMLPVKSKNPKDIIMKSDSIMDYTFGYTLYECFSMYLLEPSDFVTHGYPLELDKPGCAYIDKNSHFRNKFKQLSDELKTCVNCDQLYAVDDNGFPLTTNDCHHHWGKLYRKKRYGQHNQYYNCCASEVGSDPCHVSQYHVTELKNEDHLEGFVKTPPYPEDADINKAGIFALDCEMCYSTHGLEVARCSLVSIDRTDVYDVLIKPDYPILDYCTRFSGITEEKLANVTTRLEDVQKYLLSRISDKTILIGHSLENDLKALKILHYTVIDTSVLYPHKYGLPRKNPLRAIANTVCDLRIQSGENGHNSIEDSETCISLVLAKVKEDAKIRKPRITRSINS